MEKELEAPGAKKSKMSLESAMVDFAWQLYLAAGKEGSNTFISPVSISVALAMAYAGADGTTEEEMASIMFNGMEKSKIHESFAKLMDILSASPEDKATLTVANKMYGQKDYDLLPQFTGILDEHYKSKMESVNFGDPSVRLTINKWVEEQTRDKIKDLIPEGVLNNLTRLVLVNAIYFKGLWQNQFKERNTKPETFHVSPNSEKQVPMMHITEKLLYNENEKMQVLGMPYQSEEKRLTMFAFLPKERFGLEDLEKNSSGSELMELAVAARKTKVIVQFPKFKMEESMDLTGALKTLGMPEMFSNSADFSKMTGKKDLFVSAVLHKAFIEVNEKGTEAAAATAVMMRAKCMRKPQEPPSFIVNEEGSEAAAATAVVMQLRCAMIERPISFKADHPFLFGIFASEKESTATYPLFMGRYFCS